MANPFVHVELNTTDLSKAKTFYGALFDWKLEDVPMGAMGTYTTIGVGGGVGGGMMTHPMPGQPSFWLSYVNVDDIKAATAKAKSLGAQIFVDSQEIPNIGWMTIMNDPLGSRVALFQPKT